MEFQSSKHAILAGTLAFISVQSLGLLVDTRLINPLVALLIATVLVLAIRRHMSIMLDILIAIGIFAGLGMATTFIRIIIGLL